MDFQAVIDMMNKATMAERSRYHLTLGDLSKILAVAPAGAKVAFEDGAGLGDLESYRGFYSDLAFRCVDAPVSAKTIRQKVDAAIGRVFCGYKGGDYLMVAETPLWRSEYGCCSGLAIIRADMHDGTLTLVTKQVD